MNLLAQPFTIPALLFFVLALPLIFGLIPPNRFYGVRAPQTLANPDVWYRTNRAAGVALVVSGGIYCVVAVVLPSVVNGNTDFGRWLIHLGAFAGPLLISLGVLRGMQ